MSKLIITVRYADSPNGSYTTKVDTDFNTVINHISRIMPNGVIDSYRDPRDMQILRNECAAYLDTDYDDLLLSMGDMDQDHHLYVLEVAAQTLRETYSDALIIKHLNVFMPVPDVMLSRAADIVRVKMTLQYLGLHKLAGFNENPKIIKMREDQAAFDLESQRLLEIKKSESNQE